MRNGDPRLLLFHAPLLRQDMTTPSAMRDVIYALLPATGAALWFFGISALLLLGASIVGGFDLIADELGRAEAPAEPDLVITGEGQLDRESFNGKVVGGVVELAAEVDVPVVVIAGRTGDDVGDLAAGTTVVSLVERFGEQQALDEPVRCTTAVLGELLDSFA